MAMNHFPLGAGGPGGNLRTRQARSLTNRNPPKRDSATGINVVERLVTVPVRGLRKE